MNFTKTASIIGLLLLTMSCGKVADKEFGDPIVLDLTKDPVDMKLSDFVERVSHIYLENTSEALIGNIDKIVYNNERFYILDRSIAKKVLVFDSSGKFLFKIGALGGGPGEFVEVTSFTIDNRNDMLYVYDCTNLSISKFDKDGKFIETIVVDFYAMNVEFHNDRFVYYTNYTESKKGPYNIIVTDMNGNVVSRQFPFKEKSSMHGFSNTCFHQSDGELRLVQGFDNEIYGFDEDKAYPKFQLLFKGKPISIANFPDFDQLEDYLMEHSRVVDFYNESDDLIYFLYFDRGKTHNCFYFKQSGDLRVGSLQNDLELLPFTPMAFMKGNKLIGYIKTEDVKYTHDYIVQHPTEFPDDQIHNFNKIAQGVELSDNPIISIYHFKPF